MNELDALYVPDSAVVFQILYIYWGATHPFHHKKPIWERMLLHGINMVLLVHHFLHNYRVNATIAYIRRRQFKLFCMLISKPFFFFFNF